MTLVLRGDAYGIAALTLNRPDALNAMGPDMFVELRAHIDEIAADTEGIGCVILTGAGKSFSAGNDLKAIQSGERAPSKHFQAETIDALEALPQPVICSVRGHCFTGAMELMLACDLLVASDTAQFRDTHGKWGMVPMWGMTQRLPRRVGPAKAKEIMLTGRTIDGAEAERIGLANACVSDAVLDTYVLQMAQDMVTNSWHTLRADKMLADKSRHMNLADGLAFERYETPGVAPDMARRLADFGSK